MAIQRGDYESKKAEAIEKLASTLEECLKDFSEEEQANIREDLANYTIGYLGVSFGLHVKRR